MGHNGEAGAISDYKTWILGSMGLQAHAGRIIYFYKLYLFCRHDSGSKAYDNNANKKVGEE